MKQIHHKHTALVKGIIVGMSDALTIPFALTAGLSTVVDTNHLIIVSGIAGIAAGCISMGLGGYMLASTEKEHYELELKRGFKEIRDVPLLELEEIEKILARFGVDAALSSQVALQVSKDKKHWADFIMKFELSLDKPASHHAAKSAGTITLSYLIGGFIPLFPYLLTDNSDTGFTVSSIISIAALIIFGYFKSKITGQPIIKGILRVALTSIVAAAVAFLLAKAVS